MDRILLVGVLISLFSHVAFGIFPFVIAPVTQAMGPRGGSLLGYLIACVFVALAVSLMQSARKDIAAAIRGLAKSGWRGALLQCIVTYAIAAAAYYQGLSAAGDAKAAFAIFTKLDNALPTLFAIFWARTRPHWFNFVGSLIAVGASLMTAYIGHLPFWAIVYGVVYIAFSTIAAYLVVVVLDSMTPLTLVGVRTVVVTIIIGGVALLPPVEMPKMDAMTSFASAWRPLLVGILLVVLFLTRYYGVKNIGLWRYYVIGAVQPFVMAGMSALEGKPVPSELFAWFSACAVGECIAFAPVPKRFRRSFAG